MRSRFDGLGWIAEIAMLVVVVISVLLMLRAGLDAGRPAVRLVDAPAADAPR